MFIQKLLTYTIPWDYNKIFNHMNHTLSLEENIKNSILQIMREIFEGKCFNDAMIQSVDNVVRYSEPTYTHGTIQTIVQRNVQCMTTCLVYSSNEIIVNAVAENKHANALFANAPSIRLIIEKDTENQINSIIQDNMIIPVVIESTSYQPFKTEILGHAKPWHPQWKPFVIFEVEPGESMEVIQQFRGECKSPPQLNDIGKNIAIKLIYPGFTPRQIPSTWQSATVMNEYPKYVCWVQDSPYIIYEFDETGKIDSADIRKGRAKSIYLELLASRNQWYSLCQNFQTTFPDEQAFAKNKLFWKWCMQKKKDKKSWVE